MRRLSWVMITVSSDTKNTARYAMIHTPFFMFLWTLFSTYHITVKFRKQAPPNISPPGACTWKIALKYKVKQSKNGKFTSNYKASPIDFETQISLRR